MVSDERITNGGMEVAGANANLLANWTIYMSNASNVYVARQLNSTYPPVHAGTALCEFRAFAPTSDYGYIQQTVNLTGVTSITYYIRARHESYPVNMCIYIDGNLVNSYIQPAGVISKTTWTLVTVSISGYTGNHTLRLQSNLSGAYTSCFIDDVSALATVLADFTVSNSTPIINRDTVIFTDTSQGASSYLWDFGDGTTSTLQSPTKMYTSGGVKTVTLKINGQTTGDYVKTATVTVQDPRILVRSGIEWL